MSSLNLSVHKNLVYIYALRTLLFIFPLDSRLSKGRETDCCVYRELPKWGTGWPFYCIFERFTANENFEKFSFFFLRFAQNLAGGWRETKKKKAAFFLQKQNLASFFIAIQTSILRILNFYCCPGGMAKISLDFTIENVGKFWDFSAQNLCFLWTDNIWLCLV